MALNIKLKPNEIVIINGCIIENGPRKSTLKIKNFANVVRESDLITRGQATTPLSAIYYAIQSVLTNPSIVEKSVVEIQRTLAQLHTLLPDDESKDRIMEAANHVSAFNFYKALRVIRPLMENEAELLPEAASHAHGK